MIPVVPTTLSVVLCLAVHAAHATSSEAYYEPALWADYYLAASWDGYYVDNTWTGATHGTMAEPFTNIQAAINFANATNGAFGANTINVKDTGAEYPGPLMFPNINAMRLKGWGGTPTIAYRGSGPHSTIMSGTNYASPLYACMPPSQVGLEDLVIINETTAPGDWYCADIQAWVSWEPGLTNTPERYRFGVTNCVFNGAGRNGGVRLRDLDQGHMVPWGIPYANYHTSLVQQCRFDDCRTGVMLMPLQCARIADNTFTSNGVAITALQTNFWPYIRPYTNVVIAFNIFHATAGDAIKADNFDQLLVQNNTFYQNGGTGVNVNAAALGYHGTAGLHNNLLYENYAGFSADAADTNALIANNNLLYTNAVADPWDSFGTSNVYADPQFVSTDPLDPLFLAPLAGGPADNRPGHGGVNFIGAKAPVPEPAAALLMLCCMMLPARRKTRPRA